MGLLINWYSQTCIHIMVIIITTFQLNLLAFFRYLSNLIIWEFQIESLSPWGQIFFYSVVHANEHFVKLLEIIFFKSSCYRTKVTDTVTKCSNDVFWCTFLKPWYSQTEIPIQYLFFIFWKMISPFSSWGWLVNGQIY